MSQCGGFLQQRPYKENVRTLNYYYIHILTCVFMNQITFTGNLFFNTNAYFQAYSSVCYNTFSFLLLIVLPCAQLKKKKQNKQQSVKPCICIFFITFCTLLVIHLYQEVFKIGLAKRTGVNAATLVIKLFGSKISSNKLDRQLCLQHSCYQPLLEKKKKEFSLFVITGLNDGSTASSLMPWAAIIYKSKSHSFHWSH